MPDVTDLQIAPRRARSRRAALPVVLAILLVGWQVGPAPRIAPASFKTSATIPAAKSELARDTATAKKAAAKAAVEVLDGPALGDRVEVVVPKANIAKPAAEHSAAAAHPASTASKPIPAVATATAVPAKAASATTAASCPIETAPCHPEAKPCLPRTADEIWLISTRCLGCPDCEADPPDFGVWQYDLQAHQWNRSSLKAFLADQTPSKPDVVWIHGYRIDAAEAEEQGLGVYEQLTSGVSGDHSIRLIVYSWAATPTAGIIEDTRLKAARTNSEGYYLAWLVNHIDRRVPVNFIGYSFGAHIATGALELLAGGSLMGRALADRVEHRAPMHSILIAAAMNDDWLAMGRPHGQALEATDRMLALNNGCDRALKHYAIIDPCTRPEALGYTGVIGPLGENGRKLYEIDLCCTVGKQHNWRSYFYNPGVVARMRPYVGLDDETRLQTAERKVQNEGHAIGN